MGRFYKTSKPEMIDFMFKLPEQAIMTAVKGADAQLEGQEAYLTDLQKQLKTAALDPDEAKRKARVAELEKKISEHSLKIWENPLAAIKEQKGIRDLGQEIFKDLTEGELYAYNTNAAIRKEFEKKAIEDATGKDGRLNVDQVKNAMRAYDLQYELNKGAQFNKETGKFNPYGTELLYDYMDNSEYAKKTAENWEPTTTENWKKTKEGAYWKTEMTKTEILGLNDLTMGILNTMTLDEKVTQPLVQGIQHQAQIKAIEEIKRTGGDYKALYDQYFDKLYQQEFGEIDPDTGQLALKPVIDPATNQQAIDPITKKPITEFKNPGNLYRIAKAAADKKDKNNITTKEDYDADPFDLQAAGKALELANARALEADKMKKVWDSDNNSFEGKSFAGKTVEEVEANFTTLENKLNTDAENYKTRLLTILSKDKTQTEITAIKNQLDAYFKPDKIDFTGLKSFVGTKVLNQDPNLTTVDEFEKNYNKAKTDLENQKTVYNALYEEAEENLSSVSKNLVSIQNSLISMAKKEIEKKKEEMSASSSQDRKDSLAAEIVYLEKQIAYSEANKKKIIGANLNLDPKVKGNKNTIARSSLQTSGELYRSWGATDEEANTVQKALDDLGTREIFDILGGATNTKTRSSDNTSMTTFSGTTLANYFRDKDTYSTTYDDAGNITVVNKKENNKIVFEGKIGKYQIAVDDFEEVGANSISTTILGKDEKGNTVSYDLYIPSNELRNTDVNKIQQKFKAEQEFTAFQRDAEASIQNIDNFKGMIKYNDEIYIAPNGKGKGKAVWYFLTSDPNKPEIAETSDQALRLFKKYTQ
jgi:hypothetical protein